MCLELDVWVIKMDFTWVCWYLVFILS